MSSNYYRYSPESATYVANNSPYPDEATFYNSASGDIKNGSEAGDYRNRTGIAITVSVPPTLRAVRFPNMVSNGVTPYMANGGVDEVAYRSDWYNAVKAYVAESSRRKAQSVAAIERKISRYRSLLKAVADKKDAESKRKARVYRNKIAALTKQKAEISKSITSQPQLYDVFTTEFEISDFVKSLSWSSSRTNSFVEVSLELDNLQGIFNFLPEIAKITIWRKRSVPYNSKSNLYSGKWYRYITCYVTEKTQSVSARSNNMSLTCWDRGGFIEAQELGKVKQWTKDKRHKKGWTPREITIDICKRAKIPYDPKKIPDYVLYEKITKLADGRIKRSYAKAKFPRIEYTDLKSKKLAAAISGAWNQSILKMPVKLQYAYHVHMRKGVLEVLFVDAPGGPLTQLDAEGQRQLAVFDDSNISSATLNHSIDSEETYTVMVAKGTYRKGYKRNKKGKRVINLKTTTHTFYPSGLRGQLLLRAYGRLKKEVGYHQIFRSKKEFMRTAQNELDKIKSRPLPSLSIDDARAPLGIWPIYYVTIKSRELGVKGNIMVNAVNYTVENGVVKVSSIDLEIAYKHFSSGEDSYTYPPIEERWY